MFYILSLSQPISTIHNKHTEICRLCFPSAELQETFWFYSIKIDLDVNCLKLEAGYEPVLIIVWYSLSPMRHLIFPWRNQLHTGHLQPESLDQHLYFLTTYLRSLAPSIRAVLYLFFTLFFLVNSIIITFFNSCRQPDPSHCHLSPRLLNDLFLFLAMDSLFYDPLSNQNSLFQDRHNHFNPLFKTLSWLPVIFRTKSKLPFMIFKALYNLNSAYLSRLISSFFFFSFSCILAYFNYSNILCSFPSQGLCKFCSLYA